MTTLKALRI